MMQLIATSAPTTHATLLGVSSAAPAGEMPFGFLIPMGLILVIFYFLLIRPANKKQKALQAMITDLKFMLKTK